MMEAGGGGTPNASDLYPVVIDLTEAEYGGFGCCCNSSEILGSFSLADLMMPSILPLPLSPSTVAREEDDCILEARPAVTPPTTTKNARASSRTSEALASTAAPLTTSRSRSNSHPGYSQHRASKSPDSPEFRRLRRRQGSQVPTESSFDGDIGVESSLTRNNSVSISMDSSKEYVNISTSSSAEASSNAPPKFDQAYVLIKPIIRCSVSTVWECVHRPTGVSRCAKIVDRRRFSGASDEEATVREIAILRSLAEYKCPHLTSLVSVFEDQYQVYIVMGYEDGTSLMSRLFDRGTPSLSELSIKSIAHSLLEGVQQLHSLNITHHNLSEDNLIVVERGGILEVKVCDFGCAVYAESESNCCRGRIGRLTHTAPEILRKKKHTKLCDMWSVGVILYRCFSGQLPFDNPSKRKLTDLIIRADYNFEQPAWSTVSRHAKQFISTLLQADPNVRSTSRDALDHPWLAPLVVPLSLPPLSLLPPISPVPRSPPPKKTKRGKKKVLNKIGSFFSSSSSSTSDDRRSVNERATSMTHEISSVSTFSSKASHDRSPLWRRRKLSMKHQ